MSFRKHRTISFKLKKQINIDENVKLEIRSSTIKTRLGQSFTNVKLPVDRAHFTELIKYFGQKKIWERYWHLKKTYPDLRPRDAATVHKAQGSSHDVVLIDLGDISSCHQTQTAARLLYVAFTRARQRVVLYGGLAAKYGGLIDG